MIIFASKVLIMGISVFYDNKISYGRLSQIWAGKIFNEVWFQLTIIITIKIKIATFNGTTHKNTEPVLVKINSFWEISNTFNRILNYERSYYIVQSNGDRYLQSFMESCSNRARCDECSKNSGLELGYKNWEKLTRKTIWGKVFWIIQPMLIAEMKGFMKLVCRSFVNILSGKRLQIDGHQMTSEHRFYFCTLKENKTKKNKKPYKKKRDLIKLRWNRFEWKKLMQSSRKKTRKWNLKTKEDKLIFSTSEEVKIRGQTRIQN